MSLFLRVGITEDERKELDKYLRNYPFGQISYILRRAVKEFIHAEKLKEEPQHDDQSRKRLRTKTT